ncbi:MAG: AMP-dependent synthetase/ligase [Varibaculum sp.]|nr:AMP-dependent synthetase/ligase [Varibaculum sp.]
MANTVIKGIDKVPHGAVEIAGKPGELSEFKQVNIDELEEWMNIAWTFRRRLETDPNQVAIERKTQMGNTWRPVTAQEFSEEMDSVARGFIGLGLKPGDRIAILGPTSYEWTLLDMAALSIGLVVVPIYETDSAEQISWILGDSAPRLAVVFNQTAAQLLTTLIEKDNVDCRLFSLASSGMVQIIRAGANVAQAAVESYAEAVHLSNIATIVYTSGTTGKPKGVVITHRMVVQLVVNGIQYMPTVVNTKKARCLLFLPLAHVYGRLIQFYSLGGPGVLGHVPDTKNLLADVAAFRPTYLIAVPRVLEKVYNAADAKAGRGLKLRLFRWSAASAISWSKALDTETGPSVIQKFRHRFYYTLVTKKIADLLGGRVRHIISGGGPLGLRLNHFFRGIGIIVMEGYGLTETIGPITVNLPDLLKVGSVGRAIPGASIRIADDGEIQVYGDTVTPGYYNNDEANAAAFTEDGWFKTGDKGRMDEQGFLYITGRMKDIIVTAGGKNVAPEILEDRLRGHPLVSQVVVVGDRRPFISALITLDAEMLPGWLTNHGLPPMDVVEAASNPKVVASIQKGVERANRAVSRAESIRKIRILNTDFTEENGLLTPSLKIKRGVVNKKFASEIDEIYGGPIQEEQLG